MKHQLFAQGIGVPGGGQISAPGHIPTGGQNALETALRGGVTLFLIVIVIVALIFFVWAGIDWTMSGGDKEAIGKARAKITYAIVGIIVAFASFFIINIIGFLFGIKLLG